MIDVKLISIWFGRFVFFSSDWIESIFSKPFICSQFVFDISWKCHVKAHTHKPGELKRNYRVRFLWCARWSIVDGRLAWARHENIGTPIITIIIVLMEKMNFVYWIYCCKTLILCPDAPFRNTNKNCRSFYFSPAACQYFIITLLLIIILFFDN